MLLAGAQIFRLPERHVVNRLSIRDRLDLHAMGERIDAAGFACIIGRDADAAHGHDFVQFNARADGTAAWTFVRSGSLVTVWHGTHGPDLGMFEKLGEAIVAALAAAPYSYRRTRRQSMRPAGIEAGGASRMDENARPAVAPSRVAGAGARAGSRPGPCPGRRPGPLPGH